MIVYIFLLTKIVVDAQLVYDVLTQFAEVTECHLTYGCYDVVVRIEVESNQRVKEIIDNVRKYTASRMTLVVQE